MAATFVNSIVIGATAEEEAVTSAQKWLSVVDDQKYEESGIRRVQCSAAK
jgi:hypothetical protein